MNLYREATSPELAEYALGWTGVNPQTRRLLFALAKRLEQEYQRAERHKDKTIEAMATIQQQAGRLGHLEHCLNTNRPGPGYIKVAKPHIQLVSTVPQLRGMWRCTGSFGTVQYGNSPSEAYAAWRRVMERGHGIPGPSCTRRVMECSPGNPAGPARFRMNYMRKD